MPREGGGGGGGREESRARVREEGRTISMIYQPCSPKISPDQMDPLRAHLRIARCIYGLILYGISLDDDRSVGHVLEECVHIWSLMLLHFLL